MGIESVSGSNKPTLAPLDQDLQLGSTTGTKGTGRKDELTPEETMDAARDMLEYWHYCRRMVEARVDAPINDYASAMLAIRNGDDSL